MSGKALHTAFVTRWADGCRPPEAQTPSVHGAVLTGALQLVTARLDEHETWH